MYYYLIVKPAHDAAEQRQEFESHFPNMTGEELYWSLLEYLEGVWPGIEEGDIAFEGGVYRAETRPPKDLPKWLWVTELTEEDARNGWF